MAFRDQIRLAYDPLWRQQTAWGSPRLQSDLTATLTATAITTTRELRKQLFFDCANQVLRRQKATARLRRLTIQLQPSAHQLAGFLAAVAGSTVALTGTDPKTQSIRMLAKQSRNMPVFTWRVGMEDGTSLGFLLEASVISLVLSASAGSDSIWTLTVNLVGAYNWTAATGTGWPTCVDEAPLALYDSSLSINSTEYINTTRAIQLSVDSRAPVDRTPYVAGGLDIKRLIRAARRDYELTAAIEGVEDSTDALYSVLEANNGVGTEEANSALRVGPTGECVTVNIPKADWSFQDTAQGYDGDPDAEESVLNTVLMPKDVSGSALAPINFAATLPAAQLSQQMLLTA